jgi:hypothetical protein
LRACLFRKRHPEITLPYTRFKFPVLAYKPCSVARHIAMDILFVSDLSPAFADYAASSLFDFLQLARGTW